MLRKNKMKKAIVNISFDLLNGMLFGDKKVKITRAALELEYPDEIRLLIEGDELPDSCSIPDIPGSVVKQIKPVYQRVYDEVDVLPDEVFRVRFLNWGE
jgi:hypothetical protein